MRGQSQRPKLGSLVAALKGEYWVRGSHVTFAVFPSKYMKCSCADRYFLVTFKIRMLQHIGFVLKMGALGGQGYSRAVRQRGIPN